MRQADGSLRETGGAAMAQLLLGGLDEETAFLEFDVDCDASSSAARARPQLPLLIGRGRTSGRRIRLDPALDAAASPATRLSPAEARALLGTVGLGEGPTLGRPSLWAPPAGCRSAVAALAAVVTAAWAEDTLAGLADSGTTLADGTALLVG